MPCYDYRCPSCKHEEEDIVQTLKEAEDKLKCPVCNGTMERKPSDFGFKIDV